MRRPARSSCLATAVCIVWCLSACPAFAASPGWAELTAELGTPALRIPAIGPPRRLALAGVDVPRSVTDAGVARAHARQLLQRHLPAFATGVAPSDLVARLDALEHGVRSVVFAQLHDGMPVFGGGVGFRYKHDRLLAITSELYPDVDATFPANPLATSAAATAALSWTSEAASQLAVRSIEGPMVLPLRDRAGFRYPVAYRVRVAARQPFGMWEVFIEASSGARLTRRQRLVSAVGTLHIDAPVRHPDGPRSEFPAARAAVLVDGQYTTTDASGALSWVGTAAVQLVASSQGPDVEVTNASGPAASLIASMSPGDSALWSDPNDPQVDAQLSAFSHASIALDRVRAIGSALDDVQVPIEVNVVGSCNAFYDGDKLSFFLGSGVCHNSARLADIVYHELGHLLHDHAFVYGRGLFDEALSEGLGDYFAATITGDSGVGRGMYKSEEPLRDIDPPNVEYRWPEDVKVDDHLTGLIISGALWDLRKALSNALGDEAGEQTADRLFYQALRWATDIPGMYFEVLVADDDDGNLANGTPHVCLIDEAFDAHGLRELRADASLQGSLEPGLDGYPLQVNIIGLHPQCPADATASATLSWRLRGSESLSTIQMDVGQEVVSALLPTPPDGSVVQYQVSLQFEDGVTKRFPANPADPFYELFVGHVEPLYCTDFEVDPGPEGWGHGLVSGTEELGADDWMWGAPIGFPGSGDPRAAFSGMGALGNDLGGGSWNGEYQKNKVNFARSPKLKVEPHSRLRLQYRRWLNVEDGYFDEASIRVDDEVLWRNALGENSKSSVLHHRDAEWRFHDVPIDTGARTELALRFQLATDGSFELGGWTLDDLCVVEWLPTECGDGRTSGAEECDDGEDNSDTSADACRSDCRLASCGDGVVDQGEECDDANRDALDGCDADCRHEGGGLQPAGGCACQQVTSRREGGWSVLLLLGVVAIRRRFVHHSLPCRT